MTETRIPPLPSEAVDFNVLHDALIAGDSGDLAATKGIAAARGQDFSEGPSLKGKTIPELNKIAEKEDVFLTETMQKPDIIAAIEAKRIAALVGGPAEPVDLPPDHVTDAATAAEPDGQ